jgi:glucose dehydrogenase
VDGRKLVFTIGKPGILWKLDRQTGQFLGHKETVFQNIFDSIDQKTGAPNYRGDLAFVGDLDRSFRAFDVRSGKILWQTRQGTSVLNWRRTREKGSTP